MVHLHHGLNYKSQPTILFQRLTVILSDFVLVFGIYRLTRNLGFRERVLMWVLVIFSPGLMIVDHLHFQYNGFLLGILLISVSALEEGKDLIGGFVFAVLLCFKHLFAVAAPVYFVYLLWLLLPLLMGLFSIMGRYSKCSIECFHLVGDSVMLTGLRISGYSI